MNGEQQSSKARRLSKLDFIAGFIGWLVVHGLMVAGFVVLTNILIAIQIRPNGLEFIFLCLLPLANLVVLPILFWKRRSVAIGAILALILSCLVEVALGISRATFY